MWLSGRWCTTCRTVHPPGRYGVSSWPPVNAETVRRRSAGSAAMSSIQAATWSWVTGSGDKDSPMG